MSVKKEKKKRINCFTVSLFFIIYFLLLPFNLVTSANLFTTFVLLIKNKYETSIFLLNKT